MRSRRKSNVKNIKDYIVPIITFGLIFVLIYVAFSGSDWKNINSSSSSTEKSQNTNDISIKFDGKDSKAMVVDESDKKRDLETGDSLTPGQTVMVEKGSVSFNIPGEAHFSLNKNGELKYGKDSQMNLRSSALWIESQNDLVMDMKFASVKIGKDSVVNLEQNEVSSTIYLLKGTAEVENLAWVSTFLSQGKQLKISNKNASKEDLDLVALKEDFDDYFKISDWYLKNNGSVALESVSKNTLKAGSGSSLLWDDDSTLSLSGSSEKRKPLTTSNLLSFDKIYDEGSVSTPLTTISWKFADENIASIEIQWKKVSINQENKTFSVTNIDTSKQANDLIIKVLDGGDNVIAKYLYTLYYSWGKADTSTNWFAKINAKPYPVNWDDFIVSIPTAKNGETYSSENTFYGTVKNPDVSAVLVNGYRLKTFNGKTFRYHAYLRFKTLWEWVNNYEIKYLWKDWKVILKKYVTINKKTKVKTNSVVPTNVSAPKAKTSTGINN